MLTVLIGTGALISIKLFFMFCLRRLQETWNCHSRVVNRMAESDGERGGTWLKEGRGVAWRVKWPC